MTDKRDARRAVDAYMARSRPVVVLPSAREAYPAPARCAGLDELIASLPEDSGERFAWSELRRLRARVVLYLERLARADTHEDTVNAAIAGGEELAQWMEHAQREWPRPKS